MVLNVRSQEKAAGDVRASPAESVQQFSGPP